jgi:hypothetical protein
MTLAGFAMLDGLLRVDVAAASPAFAHVPHRAADWFLGIADVGTAVLWLSGILAALPDGLPTVSGSGSCRLQFISRSKEKTKVSTGDACPVRRRARKGSNNRVPLEGRSLLAVDTPQRPHSNPVRAPAGQAIRVRAMALTALAYRRVQPESSSDARRALTRARAQPRASLIENE